MTTNTMYNFISIYGSKIAIIFFAVLAGEGFSIIEAANNHAGLLAAMSGIITALVVKYVDKWFDGRNKTIKTGDKILEIETAEKDKLRAEQKELMQQKEAWWKHQNDQLKAEHFEAVQRHRANIKEAREINHAAVNQIMTQQNVILGMQRTLVINNLPIPEVSMLSLTKFMLPMWENEADEQNADTTMVSQPG